MMMFVQTTTAVAAATLAAANLARAADPEEGLPCVPMGDLYPTPEELCETMWDNSFQVVDDDSTGYVMWHYEDTNPNDLVSANRGLSGADKKCYLDDFFHKAVPGPEPLENECGPFRGDACCKASTVPNSDALRDAYGPGYSWDRCGKLSPQCERFFVQEACFYECDPNNGYWRKFVDASAPMPDSDKERFVYNPKCNPRDEKEWDDIEEESGKSPKGELFYKNNKGLCNNTKHNRWQLWKTPIKRSYCQSWHSACRKDLFCGVKDGSFFQCAREAPVPEPQVVEKPVLSDGAIAGITVAALLVGIAVAAIGYMAVKERRGEPVFERLRDVDVVEKDDKESDNHNLSDIKKSGDDELDRNHILI